jgi:hypothetical protein
MNNRTIARLSVIAVIGASLLAVGVVAVISMTEEADALRQSSSVSITQSTSSSGGTASNSASVTQSNSATHSL